MKKIIKIFTAFLVTVLMFSLVITGCSNAENEKSTCEPAIYFSEYSKDNNLNLEVISKVSDNECIRYQIQIPVIIENEKLYFWEVINPHTDDIRENIYYKIKPSRIIDTNFEYYSMENPIIAISKVDNSTYTLGMYVGYTTKNAQYVEDIIEVNYRDLDNLQVTIID